MKQKQQFNETLYADVEYFDEKGNFDFRKFANGAAEAIKLKNKEDAQNQLLKLQEKWDNQRKEIRNQKLEVNSRPVNEYNQKQIKVIEQLKKKQQKLLDQVKSSKQIDQEIIQIKNKGDNIKKPTKVAQINQKMDKLTADQARIRLFRFDQMEKVTYE